MNDITEYKISNDGIFVDINKIPTMDILEGESAKNAFINIRTAKINKWTTKTSSLFITNLSFFSLKKNQIIVNNRMFKAR